MRSSFYGFAFLCGTFVPALGQVLEPDAPGCVDSKILPKLAGCRIDNCENKDSDRRDVAIRENEKGEPVTTGIEGESRSVMYECREGTTPAGVVRQALALLKEAHFEIPYQFADQEGAITAQTSDLWILLEAASRYYTLVELKPMPANEGVIDAAEMADSLERNGRVTIYGVEFSAARAEITPASEAVLKEVVAMLEDHAEWRIRIEARTEPHSQAIVAWLAAHGIPRTRLEPGSGALQIELVRIGASVH